MKKIGTRNTSKPKYKGTAYKCDLCGRKFMSLDALKSHQRSVHNLMPNKSRVKQYGKQAKKLEVKEKVVKKEADMESTITHLRSTRAKSEKVTTDPPKSLVATTKTVEFECPKCFKSFHTYILASRHIQKFHCVDKKGGKVSPSSAIIIQPERKELCLKCNRKVKSIPSHICGIANKLVEDEGLIYNCTACETTFNNKRSFYSHVITSHPEGVESLFFPTNTEFMKWKQEMETQTNTKYSELDKFDSKCYYHCEYQSGNAIKASINICPSIIVIQEFTKGIQVHYYKKHYKHGTKNYKLLNKYKKFSITAFLKSSDCYFDLTDIKYDDNDMYVQFKKLMESIVLDAAKLKMDSLTILFGKALEMTTILTGYDDEMSDDGSKPMKRNMTDSQIVKALEEPPVNTENVEEHSEPQTKKFKNDTVDSDVPSPMILNSFSLADNIIKENSKPEPTDKLNIKVKDIATLQAPNETTEDSEKKDVLKTENIPASFNESYAEFLEKNFPDAEPIGKRRSDRRNVMKTKIGQYKPPSPKKVLLTTPKLVPTSITNNNIEIKRKSNVAIEEQNKRKLITPSTQDKEMKQDNITSIQDKRKSIKTPLLNTKFKNIATPIQEIKRKPTTPIQDIKVIKSKPRSLDVEYEVKEQEDDCNILILKI